MNKSNDIRTSFPLGQSIGNFDQDPLGGYELLPKSTMKGNRFFVMLIVEVNQRYEVK